MKIELRKLADIKPYPGNPAPERRGRGRRGRVDPAVRLPPADRGRRRGRDHRAATPARRRRRSWAWQGAGPRGHDLTPEQIKAYRIADNKTATLADLGLRPAADRTGGAPGLDFDLGLLGFATGRAGQAARPGREGGADRPGRRARAAGRGDHQAGRPLDPRRPPAALRRQQQAPRTSTGCWTAPRSTLVNTDPPYNVKVEPRSQQRHRRRAISSFQRTTHHQQLDLARHPEKAKPTHREDAGQGPAAGERLRHATRRSTQLLARLVRQHRPRAASPGRAFYIWGGYANCGNYPPVLKACELYFSQAIIWDKEHPVLTRKDFMGNHEWCFYGWKEGAAHQFFGPNNATDVWHVKKVNPQQMVHLTEKPVELAVRAMQYSSRAGENVLDLFGGSGSTLIAAEQTGRKAFLMELDPPYCDVIVQRWEKFTGRKAEPQQEVAVCERPSKQTKTRKKIPCPAE